ncbi:hypothetical protein B0H19DRAFT_1274488 [Mycena capillaripes]|nr:hypothetical protein B0H19DRAFT_1274488 [Mycena capillaripes]
MKWQPVPASLPCSSRSPPTCAAPPQTTLFLNARYCTSRMACAAAAAAPDVLTYDARMRREYTVYIRSALWSVFYLCSLTRTLSAFVILRHTAPPLASLSSMHWALIAPHSCERDFKIGFHGVQQAICAATFRARLRVDSLSRETNVQLFQTRWSNIPSFRTLSSAAFVVRRLNMRLTSIADRELPSGISTVVTDHSVL